MSSLWIIPAYAGSTPTCPKPDSPSPDHPRIRGEHGPGIPSHKWVSGSSPHTRGAPLQIAWEVIKLGIIPAYAGSTCTSTRL